MRKLLIGFCMCWGNFCYIPGPKKWDDEARPYMLGWLPSVGAVMGVIWAAIYMLMSHFGLHVMAQAAVMVWLPFILSGFMHVDGYMDVNDAVMSRGTLEKKRAILKDSRCGTFAIVSFIFLVIVEFGFMYGALDKGLDPVRLVMIMIMARGFSGFMMATRKPMETSQYINLARNKKADAFMLLQMAVFMILGCILGVEYTRVLMTICCGILGTLVSILLAEKDLQGMNGDIAGYGILWGEMLGILSLVF